MGAALLIMLRSKLPENFGCCLIDAGAVEQGREFIDPAILEEFDGPGAGGVAPARGADGLALVVAEPVLAVLEGVGRQVQLVGRALSQRTEFGQVSGDVGAAEGFGDLAVVCDIAAQRRYRLGRCRGVRPGPQGCSGEHRLRADLEQHRAAKLCQRRHTLGEFDRLAGMAAPVGAI